MQINLHFPQTSTALLKKINANTRIALTGTPLENSVLELWSIFDFIMPGYLTSSLAFNRKYGIKNIDDDSVKELIASKGIDKAFGARPLKRTIQNMLEDKLAEEILDGNLKAGEEVTVKTKDEKIYLEKKNNGEIK